MAGRWTWAAGRSRRTSASIATASASARPSADRETLMRRQIVARLAQSLIVVIVVTTISFFVIRLAPGDPFSYDSPLVTEEIRAHWREQFGYDKPLGVQYVKYV